MRCSTPSSTFQVDVDNDLDSYCPSRYGINFAPDLDEKPNLRGKTKYVQERCPEIGDTRLLIPQKNKQESNYAFDTLIITSQELLEAREIYCGRLEFKKSHLNSKSQYQRLVKRLTYLYNIHEKAMMQYVAECDLSNRIVQDKIVNQADDFDWRNDISVLSPNMFATFAESLCAEGYLLQSTFEDGDLILILDGRTMGHSFHIRYSMRTNVLVIVPYQESEMEVQGLFQDLKQTVADRLLGSNVTIQNVIEKAERIEVDHFNNAALAHEQAMHSIVETVEMVKSLIPSFALRMIDHLIFIIASGVIYFKYWGDKTLLSMITLMVIAHCGLPSITASCCAKLVAHLIELAKKQDLENQGDKDEMNDWTSGFMALATMIASAVGVACTGPSEPVMKKFNLFMRTSNTGFTFSNNLTKLFKLIFSQVYFWIFGVDYLGQEEQLVLEKMTDFMLRARKLIDDEVAQKLSQDLSLYFVIHDLYRDGTALMQEIQESALPKRSITPFSTIYTSVQTLWKEASMIHSSVKKKYVPTWVYLAGDTSVGKSNFQMMLVTYLREKDGLKYTDECIYERQVFNGQKFWDAYRQNYCVSVDDLFQLDDKQLRAEQAVELIKMCNAFQYPLNMAHLLDKGNRYFTSDLVITSTNRLMLGDASEMGIENIGAFCRRRDFVVYLILDPDVIKDGSVINEIDPVKLKNKYGSVTNLKGEELSLNHLAWRIYLKDKMSDTTSEGIKPRPGDKPISFVQFAEMVHKKIQEYKCPANNLPEFLKQGGVFFEGENENPLNKLDFISSETNKNVRKKHIPTNFMKFNQTIPESDFKNQGFDYTLLVQDPLDESVKEEEHIEEKDLDDNSEVKFEVEDVDVTPDVPLDEEFILNQIQFYVFRNKPDISKYEHCGVFYQYDSDFFLCDLTQKGLQKYQISPDEVKEIMRTSEIRSMARGSMCRFFLNKFLQYDFQYDGLIHNCKTHVLWLKQRMIEFDLQVDPIESFVIDDYKGASWFKTIKNKYFPGKKVVSEVEDHVLNSSYLGEVKRRAPIFVKETKQRTSRTVLDKIAEVSEKHPKVTQVASESFFFTQKNLLLPWQEFKESFKKVKEGDYKPKSVASIMGASLAKLDKDYPLLKWLLLSAAGVGILIIAYRMLRKHFKKENQGNISGDKKTQLHAKRKVNNLVKEVEPGLVNQGELLSSLDGCPVTNDIYDEMWEAAVDKQGVEILMNRVIPNMARITVVSGDAEFLIQTNILFVKGRQAIIPSHAIPKFVLDDPDSEFHVVFPSGIIITELISELVIKKWHEADLYTILLTGKFPLFTDLTKHFMLEQKIVGFDRAMFVTMSKAEFTCDPVKTSRRPIAVIQKATGLGPVEVYKVPTKYGEYETRNAFRSSGLITHKGDCIGVYMVLDKSRQKKIFGLHTAFSDVRGAHGVYVSQERLLSNLIQGDRANVFRQDEIIESYMITNQGAFPSEPKSLQPIGSVKHGTVFNGVSNIVPSIFQGVFTPIDTLPALLKQEGDLKPVDNALAKWNVELHELDKNFKPTLIEVCEELIHEWGMPDNSVPDVCTQHEALHGLGDVKHLELTTSAGYTLNHMPHSLPGKKSFINILDEAEKAKRGFVGQEDYYECGPLLRNKILDRLLLASMGVVMNTMWQDSLKDERLEIEKVKTGRTRLFMTGDVDNTVACRQYFMRFTDHIMKNRHRLPCKVGVNPDGQEWGRMWKWLNEPKKAKFIAGDFKNYDMTIPKWLTDMVVDSILKWYKMITPYHGTGLYLTYDHRKVYLDDILGSDVDKQNFIRYVLMQEISQATRINGRVVYRCLQGIPSGHFLTAIFNSILNEVIIKSSIMYYCKVKGIPMDFGIFHRNFRIATFGDDHIVAVSEEFQPWVNQMVLQQLIKILFGMGYTDSQKNLDVLPWTDRNELTFLQRYFREEEGLVFAPLKKDIIDEMINWVRISDDYSIKESSFLNLSTALKEWFHWGKSVFDEKRDLFRALCFKHSAEPFSTTYAGLYSDWLLK